LYPFNPRFEINVFILICFIWWWKSLRIFSWSHEVWTINIEITRIYEDSSKLSNLLMYCMLVIELGEGLHDSWLSAYTEVPLRVYLKLTASLLLLSMLSLTNDKTCLSVQKSPRPVVLNWWGLVYKMQINACNYSFLFMCALRSLISFHFSFVKLRKHLSQGNKTAISNHDINIIPVIQPIVQTTRCRHFPFQIKLE